MIDLAVKYGSKESGEALSEKFIGKCKLLNISDDGYTYVVEDTMFLDVGTEEELLQCINEDVVEDALILAVEDKDELKTELYVLMNDYLFTLILGETSDGDDVKEEFGMESEVEELYFGYYDLIDIEKIEW